MYEAKYPPLLDQSISALPDIRLSVHRRKRYRRHDDPAAEPLHIHQCLEIFFNISSNVSFLVNNKLYSVPIGDAVISCPGDVHMAVFQNDVYKTSLVYGSRLISPLRSSLFCESKISAPLSRLTDRQNERCKHLSFHFWRRVSPQAPSL